MFLTYIKNFSLFLFVFVAFNDTVAEEYIGNFVIKGAFALFVVTHSLDLYAMMFNVKTYVMKNFYLFMLTITTISLVTYLFKSDMMYMTDMLEVSFLRIISFFVIFIYVTYTKEFTKLLYMIWISLIVSSTIAAFSDPYEQWTFRRVGGTGNPNDFAAQLLPAMFITYYLFKKNHSWIFLIGSNLFFLYTLVYAGSKSSFLFLALLLAIAFVVRFKAILEFLTTTKGFISLVMTVIIVISAGVYIQQDEAVKGMQERSKKSGTMQQRFIIWAAGAEMIRDNFFLGVGFAQFPKISGSYIKEYLPPEALPSHNNFVKIFAESGVFTFVMFLSFIFALFMSQVRAIFSTDYFWIYLATLSAVMMSMTIPSLHHKDFWISIALLSHVIYILSYKNHDKDEKISSQTI